MGDEGELGTYTVGEGATARTLEWRFPSRAECLACHNAASGGTLSFETAQLARGVASTNGASQDQIRRLSAAGYFHNPPDHPEAFRRHPALGDERVSLEARARSYLAVNCAPCHRPGGTVGGGFFDARLETLTDGAGLLAGPLNDAGEHPDFRVVVPGDPSRSALLHRLLSVGTDRMPPISSGVVDTEGVALLERWIVSTATRTNFTKWLAERFDPVVAEAADRGRDADADGASDYLEFLTGTDPGRSEDLWRLRVERSPEGPEVRLRFRQPAGVDVALEVSRDLNSGGWEPWAGDEDVRTMPAEAVERDIALPRDESPFFLRARVSGP